MVNERLAVGTTSVIQRVLGPWSEPVASRVAGSLVGGLSGERVVRRMGLTWELDMVQNLEQRLYAIGSYEAATVRESLRRLHFGDVVLDVGANVGTFSLPIAQNGYDVIAVEAASDTMVRLQRHVALNGLEAQVVIEHLALGRNEGMVDLRSGASTDSGLRTIRGDGAVVESVRLATGDDLMRQLDAHPALVKIDVEGAELDVLFGLESTLALVRTVVVELVDSHQVRAGTTADTVSEMLSDFGFVGFGIRARGLRPWHGEPGNVLFARRESALP